MTVLEAMGYHSKVTRQAPLMDCAEALAGCMRTFREDELQASHEARPAPNLLTPRH